MRLKREGERDGMKERFGDEFGSEREVASQMKLSGAMLNTAAASASVNRTHRVVRERAKTIQAQRSRVRSLWIPLTVSFGMLALLLGALWNLLDESEFFPDGIPDSSQNLLVLSMWCLPLSVIVLAVIWSRRAGAKTSDGSPQ
jgi:hypothetical protein